MADDLVPIGQADAGRRDRWHLKNGTQLTLALYFPSRWPASVIPAESVLRSGRAARTPWSPTSAASTRTCRRFAFPRAGLRGASTCARAASRRARSPRPSGRPGAAVADLSLLRFRTVVEGALGALEARRQEVNDLNVFPVADGDT